MISRVIFESPMAQAMQRAVPKYNGGAFASQVRQATQCGAGKKSIQAWNASLTKRTAEKLIVSEVLPVL